MELAQEKIDELKAVFEIKDKEKQGAELITFFFTTARDLGFADRGSIAALGTSVSEKNGMKIMIGIEGRGPDIEDIVNHINNGVSYQKGQGATQSAMKKELLKDVLKKMVDDPDLPEGLREIIRNVAKKV